METAAAAQLQLIEAARRPLRDAVGATPDALVNPGDSDGWTIRELVAHLAFWEETVPPMLAFLLGTREIEERDWYGGDDLGIPAGAPWPATDIHNEREAAWARRHTSADAIARWDRAHEKLIALVAGLSADQLRNESVVERIAAESYRHYPDHLRELRANSGA